MWQNNVKYTPPKRYDFRLNDFTGGLCNTVTESRIKDNEASDLLNVRFEQDGLLKKRNGFAIHKKYSSILHGVKGELLRVFVLEPDASDKKGYLLLIDGKKFVYITTDGRTKTLPWSRAVTDIPIDGCQFGDKFFFVDGGFYTNCFKIKELESKDDEKVWHYMISKPQGSFTPKPKPAVKGEWKEQEASDGIGKLRWYEPCEAELEDGYKGTNSCEGFYATMIRTHKDRLYIAGNVGRPAKNVDPSPNMIYISDIFNPEYFPSALPLQTPPTGDKITCLRQFNDALIVGRKDDVYAINGNTNRENGERFTMKKINTHTGIANNYSADIVFNYLFYVGSDGNCYRLMSTSTAETLLATQQLNTKVDFKLHPFNKDISEIRNCHTAFDPIRGEWFVQIGKDTAIYNYRNMAWVRWLGTECMQFIPTDEHFFYIKEDCSFNIVDENIFYDTDVDNPDIKIPIQFYWVSKNIDFGMPSRIKQIRDTFLISEIVGTHPSDIRVKYEADYVAVVKEHNISSEVARWDLAMWDTHRFVYKNIIRSLPIVVGRRCRNFKVYIGNGYEFKGVVYSLPEPQESEEGQLYYLRNDEPQPNIFEGTIQRGGIDSSNGSLIDSSWYIRTTDYTKVTPNSKYELIVEYGRTDIIATVILYDESNQIVGVRYCGYEQGYIFDVPANATKFKISFNDATSQEDLLLQDILTIEVRKYVENGEVPTYTDGFYIRTKRDTETREYYKKAYDKDLYQPVKVHEVSGIYELRGYR